MGYTVTRPVAIKIPGIQVGLLRSRSLLRLTRDLGYRRRQIKDKQHTQHPVSGHFAAVSVAVVVIAHATTYAGGGWSLRYLSTIEAVVSSSVRPLKIAETAQL